MLNKLIPIYTSLGLQDRSEKISFRDLLKYILRLTVILSIIFYLLLVIGFAIPQSQVLSHLKDDMDRGIYDVHYPTNGLYGQKDMYTECIAASVGLRPINDPSNSLSQAIKANRSKNCNDLKLTIAHISEGKPTKVNYYYRYWNGYSPFIRLGIALGGFAGAQILSGLILLASIIVFYNASKTKLGLLPTASILGLFALTSDLTVAAGQPSTALGLAAIFTGSTIVAHYADRGKLYRILAMITAGSLYAYIDIFKNPPVAFLLPLFLIGAILLAKYSVIETLCQSIHAGLAWIYGYSVLWAVHWFISIPIFGAKEVMNTVMRETFFGLTGTWGADKNVDKPHNLSKTITLNYEYTVSQTPGGSKTIILILLLITCLSLCLILKNGINSQAPLLFLVFLVVPIWYWTMGGHSQIHYWFTYRLLSLCIALFGATLLLLPGSKAK